MPRLFRVKQPRPRICHEILLSSAGRVPFFWSFNQSFFHWVLFNIVSNEFELLGCLD